VNARDALCVGGSGTTDEGSTGSHRGPANLALLSGVSDDNQLSRSTAVNLQSDEDSRRRVLLLFQLSWRVSRPREVGDANNLPGALRGQRCKEDRTFPTKLG